jgi:hypothetical protein
MSKYVQVRAIPAEGFTKRWGARRPFTKDPVTLELVELKIDRVTLPNSASDVSQAVQEALANERARDEAHKKLGPDQISQFDLAELKADERMVVIEDAPAPPPPPKSEADMLRERVAQLEKVVSTKKA